MPASHSSAACREPVISEPEGRRVRFAFWMLLASQIVLFVGARLYQIDAVGVAKGDAVVYLRTALSWATGNYQDFYWYRPSVYLIYSSVLKSIGHPLYSIKLLNSALDVLTLLLLINVVARATRNAWWGLLGGALYGSSAVVLYFARSEFTHSLCAFSVTLFFSLLLAGLRADGSRLRHLLLSLSGLSLGVAWTTHESVAVLGLAGVLGIMMTDEASRAQHDLGPVALRKLKGCLVFSLAYAVPAVLCVSFLGFDLAAKRLGVFVGDLQKYRESLHLVDVLATEGALALPDGLRAPWDVFALSIPHLLGMAVLTLPLFLFAVVSCGVLAMRRRPQDGYAPIFLAAATLASFCVPFVVTQGFFKGHERVFVNVFPIFVIFLVTTLYGVGDLFRSPRGAVVYRAVAALLCVIVSASFPIRLATGRLAYLYEPNEVQWAYDVLKEQVNSEQRLLVLPFAFYSNDHSLTEPYYFGSDAEYVRWMSRSEDTSLDELFLRDGFSYVVWYKTSYDPRLLDRDYRRYWNIADFYGFDAAAEDGYTIDKERARFEELLTRLSSTKVAEGRFGAIYEVANAN